MVFREVKEDKSRYMDFLLEADEQEEMVLRYLYRGRMFLLDEDGVKTVCMVTDEGDGIAEIKNISTHKDYRRKGYARRMIAYIEEWLSDTYVILQVGTGDVPSTTTFYQKCGFLRSHVVKNFFTENYDHLIVEDGIQLCDMVYFRKNIEKNNYR